jgi:superfamily II DNA or RNA helicase
VHEKLIVFYNFNFELDILRQLYDQEDSHFKVAEWNGHRKQKIPGTKRWVYLVQYLSGAEGWNCIETNAMVMYSLTYSYKNWEQAMGRIDRLNSPFKELFYYPFISGAPSDRASKRALESKKNFNERRFLEDELGLELPPRRERKPKEETDE